MSVASASRARVDTAVVAATIAVAAIVGCAHGGGRSAAPTPPPHAAPRSTASPLPPAPPTLSPKLDDAQLAVRVKAALATQVGIDAFRVAVRARHGIVTIEGRAPSADVARSEVETAREIPGVTRLVNLIRVEP